MTKSTVGDSLGKIAVVGMTGRFPGAKNIEQFWENLREGKESIRFFSDDELLEANVPQELLSNPNYVKARGVYEGPYLFDASFFGYTPREAELIDPQQRVFLECAWEALEHAGYDPSTYAGRIGVFGGCGVTVHLFRLIENPAVMRAMSAVTLITSNDRDYLATRVGYKLNLRGPCVTVQTACSTSLVSIILACQSLLNYQSDLALAGGVRLDSEERGGYFYEEGSINSPDGHNRTFDASAKGTIFSCGAGIVVLKRLDDALAERDTIHAVVLGFGINNDGSARVGFTAPGVEGQAAVACDAIAMAGVHPETIGYVECHGTATPMGDPIEIAALTKAFRAFTDRKRFCAVGSVKTNIGHTDAAAGVAGFTKTVLTLKHKLIPPSLHFTKPNPQIDFENSPFFVNAKLAEWKRNGTPRRAAMNSFGIGGTNAHVIIEEAPEPELSSGSRPYQLLVWSAKTDSALQDSTRKLTAHMKDHPEDPLGDIAYTLQLGRKLFPHRRMLVCQSREDAVQALEAADPTRLLTSTKDDQGKTIGFLFPGQGTQHPNMGKGLYETESVFREVVDASAETLKAELGVDLRELLYPAEGNMEKVAQQLNQTAYTQPALFVVEYALASLWMQWGLRPAGMLGHSIGEYVAACLAGVVSLNDALNLVSARGRLMQQLPTGSMLGVLLPEYEAHSILEEIGDLSIAAVNGPSTCVASGPTTAIDQLERKLNDKNVPSRRLHTSHAFHSGMMDPILAPFRKLVASVRLSAPTLPYLSNVTGTWMTAADATDPDYWVRHLRQTVRFSDGAAELFKDQSRVLVEVGPGRTLSTLIMQHPERGADRGVFSSLPHPKNDIQTDPESLLTAMGRLWLEGVKLSWPGFYAQEKRRRIPLPTYPFEREHYEIPLASPADVTTPRDARKKTDIADWFYYPSWRRTLPLPPANMTERGCWLVFADACGVGSDLAKRLQECGQDVVSITPGEQYEQRDHNRFILNPGSQEDYMTLLKELRTMEKLPDNIIHLWGVTQKEHPQAELDCVTPTMELNFYSLFFLAKALSAHVGVSSIQINVVSSEIHDVCGDDVVCPSKATSLGPCKSIPREYPNMDSRSIDIQVSGDPKTRAALLDSLLAEFVAKSEDEMVAYRGGHRWIQAIEPFRCLAPAEDHSRLREGGVYLITGGLGGIGLVIAEYLAQSVHARLALVGRSTFPNREQWDEWLGAHGDDNPVSKKIRALRRLEELGSEVEVFSADISDHDQMREVSAQIRQRFGAIHGVIHSAGVPGEGIIELKDPKTAAQVLAPKVKGTLVLYDLFQDANLDFFVLFSSLTGIIGAIGQSDYSAANSFLDAFAHSKKNSQGIAPVSIVWDRWDEVGMAIESSTPAQVETRPEYETLADSIFAGRFSERDQRTYVAYLSASNHWIVGEHKLLGNPTLVGTAYLELARAAFAQQSSNQPIEIRDVVFMGPLMLAPGEKKELHVVLRPAGEIFDFQIKSKSADATWQHHAVGKIGYAAQAADRCHDLSRLLERCPTTVHESGEDAGSVIGVVDLIEVGHRWDNVTSVRVGENEAVATLCLPREFAGDLGEFLLHPALMDSATAFAAQFAAKESAYLPFSYNKVRINKPLPQKLYSYAEYQPARGATDEFLSFDLLLMDEHGDELVKIEGYGLKRVPDSFLQAGGLGATAAGLLAPDRNLPKVRPQPKSGQTDPRILSVQGVEVFRRALSITSMPQIVIASKPFYAIAEEMKPVRGNAAAGTSTTPEALTNAHPRPNLATPYVAPRSELEQGIAEIWGAVLGMGQVGVHDNFIELGGHSLLAVQLAARIREMFEIELSVASLYKTPTVAGLADAVVQALVGQADSETMAQLLQEIEATPSQTSVVSGAD